MTTDEDREAWEAWEQEWADRARLKGYAVACCDQAIASREALEKAVTAMTRARAKAEKALERLKADVELAEYQAQLVVELCG